MESTQLCSTDYTIDLDTADYIEQRKLSSGSRSCSIHPFDGTWVPEPHDRPNPDPIRRRRSMQSMQPVQAAKIVSRTKPRPRDTLARSGHKFISGPSPDPFGNGRPSESVSLEFTDEPPGAARNRGTSRGRDRANNSIQSRRGRVRPNLRPRPAFDLSAGPAHESTIRRAM